MEGKAKEVAQRIRKAEEVRVVTHIDADGICAGSIASMALSRAGITHKVDFLRKLEDDDITRLKGENIPLVWFTDLGSGHIHMLDGLECVITDHHVPSAPSVSKVKDRQNILSYAEGGHTIPHVNPHLLGRNGATDLSGSGATYLVAKALDPKNTDLASIATVGAVGDLQDTEARKLTGTNRILVDDGVAAGVISAVTDLRYFGRETRPVYKMIQYSSDPILPGLTSNEDGCKDFLSNLGISQKDGEDWRSWSDLSDDERKTIISAIGRYLLSKGMGWKSTIRLIGETYTLIKEEEHSELRDAKEFATLLNSCGRHGKAEIGYLVCKGDRDEWLKRARTLLQGHRRSLVEALQYVKGAGVKREKYLQWYHAHDNIPETITGTVAGMILNSEGYDRDIPMFGFAYTDEVDAIKVSARGTRPQIEAGMDLSIVMRESAKVVGGQGGGHNIAAGATIPLGKEEEFLIEAERILKEQMGKTS